MKPNPQQRVSGSTVPPNRLPASIAIKDSYGKVGPGGGYSWGGGPRQFVGGSRMPMTNIEIGRPGDFPPGGDGTPQPTDSGFPYASRWPGLPNDWEPPFFDTGGRFTGGMGFPEGSFMGGSALTGRISTVFACTDLISRTLATMPLRTSQNYVPVQPPPWTENPEPLIYTSIVDAMQALVNSMTHRGEAFIVPTARYADGTVARWVVLNPDMVDVEPAVGGMPVYSLGGVTIPTEDILHIRYQTWPGSVRGVAPLEACWRNLASADAMQSWGTQLATMNGIPMAVLQSETKLTKQQAEELKDSWIKAAMSRGVSPAILTGGLTFQPLNLRPADVGLLDLRQWDETRIASCFGVPLWLVGLPINGGLTYSTVEDTFEYFWRATLRPIAYNIGCALSNWALPRGTELRFASEQITEPSIGERANIYSTLIGAGVITPDEARQREHLSPIDQVPPTIGDYPTVGV